MTAVMKETTRDAILTFWQCVKGHLSKPRRFIQPGKSVEHAPRPLSDIAASMPSLLR